MKTQKTLILLVSLGFLGIFHFAEKAYATSVVSVVPSVSTITDVQSGQLFSVSVQFSGPMDTSNDPTIAFSPDLTATGTLSFIGTGWSPDGLTYTARYTVVDQNESYPSVDATILGANTASPALPPEPPISYTATNLFSVDTLTSIVPVPQTVVSVVPSTTIINDATVGGTFSITTTFSGPMDTSTDPTIVLTPDLYSLGTLTFVDTSWSSDVTAYTMNFTVNDLNEEYSGIDAKILGGIDVQTPATPVATYDALALFAVDTKTPTMTAGNISTSGATGNGGVYKIGDTMVVTWDSTSGGDNNADISAVSVDFSPFGGPASVAATNSGDIWTASYVIPEGTLDGVLHLNPSVTAVDKGGNSITVVDDCDATIDNKINGYTLAIDQSAINFSNQTALSFSFANAEVGATYNYDINGVVTGNGTIGAVNGTVSGIDVTAVPDGILILSATLTDVAGNIGNAVTALAKTKDTAVPVTPPVVSHSSGGGGGQINPILSDIPNYVPPSSAPATSQEPQDATVVTTVPQESATPARNQNTPVITATDTALPPPAQGTVVRDTQQNIIQPLAAVSNEQQPTDQTAAALNAGFDLFSGSKIYLWLIILVCLVVLGRTAVLLSRKEH